MSNKKKEQNGKWRAPKQTLEIPATYPDKFKAKDITTGHEYDLEFTGKTDYDKESGKIMMLYKISINKRA